MIVLFFLAWVFRNHGTLFEPFGCPVCGLTFPLPGICRGTTLQGGERHEPETVRRRSFALPRPAIAKGWSVSG